jgi:hypothetical protein
MNYVSRLAYQHTHFVVYPMKCMNGVMEVVQDRRSHFVVELGCKCPDRESAIWSGSGRAGDRAIGPSLVVMMSAFQGYIGRAEAENMTLVACHFPSPGFGKLVCFV